VEGTDAVVGRAVVEVADVGEAEVELWEEEDGTESDDVVVVVGW